MRLSGHQVNLVLSSIWIQATSMENSPENFEAMGHTYTLALSFILSKVREPAMLCYLDNSYHAFGLLLFNHCILNV